MTAWGRSRGAELHRILRIGLVLACLALLMGPAHAARVHVVLSDDATPYQEVYQVISAFLNGTAHSASRVYAEGLAPATLNDARLIVAVGVRAAEWVASQPSRVPVLTVLVPKVWYDKTGRLALSESGHSVVSAIYLDQPFERQARLIRLAFPELTRVGVLLGEGQGGMVGELKEALRSQGLSLVSGRLGSQERLIPPLENVLLSVELLLAVPDPLVFNRNTAQSLFLTSYRYRVPVLGYSRSLTRAGALLSLHSSPAQIGRQAAEWISGALNGEPLRLPPPAFPEYFSISVNEQVARSLGFALPPEAELEKRFGARR